MRTKSHRQNHPMAQHPGFAVPKQAIPSTLDVKLEAAERAFLRKLEGAGGRLFLETPADRLHAQVCLRLSLVATSPSDRRCITITAKGSAYLARLRGAE